MESLNLMHRLLCVPDKCFFHLLVSFFLLAASQSWFCLLCFQVRCRTLLPMVYRASVHSALGQNSPQEPLKVAAQQEEAIAQRKKLDNVTLNEDRKWFTLR